MGGYSYPTPRSQNFSPAAGQKKTPFLGVSKQKFSACGGQIPLVLSFYECKKALLSFVKVSNRRAGAVPVVFTSIGTRVYYSQKYLSAVCAGPLRFAMVGKHVYYSQNAFSLHSFHERRNARLPAAKR